MSQNLIVNLSEDGFRHYFQEVAKLSLFMPFLPFFCVLKLGSDVFPVNNRCSI